VSRIRPRLKLFILTILTTGIVTYSTFSLWQDWNSEKSHRAAANAEAWRESMLAKVWAACERLEYDGARIPRHKMLEGSAMQFIDLTTWHGTDKRLSPLLELSNLPELRSYDNQLYIRLGPAVGDEAASTLERLKNIAILDPANSSLTSSAMERIVDANPNLRIGTFTMPP
jgi:hypothetical protein